MCPWGWAGRAGGGAKAGSRPGRSRGQRIEWGVDVPTGRGVPPGEERDRVTGKRTRAWGAGLEADAAGKVEGRRGRVMSRKRFSRGEAGGGGWMATRKVGRLQNRALDEGSRGSTRTRGRAGEVGVPGMPGPGAGGDPGAGGAGVLEPRSGKGGSRGGEGGKGGVPARWRAA